MGMVKGALDDDRILGGIITLLMLAVVALVIGIVLWSVDAELAPLSDDDGSSSIEASPTPGLAGLTDDGGSFSTRGHVVPTF
ncbi:MAG TPA: hypothetical protein VFR16_00310 [Agromyces mariniharenae]|nr:hypothetical protein [Agromyces mariniharenae]